MSLNATKVISLIRQHGLWGLCESDGCLCCDFELHEIYVSISCRKSEHCVRVYSRYLDRSPREPEDVAKEVLAQLGDDAEGFTVRFCEFEHDRPEQTCCYCHAARENKDGYLCRECANRPEAVQLYPWVTDGFMSAVLR